MNKLIRTSSLIRHKLPADETFPRPYSGISFELPGNEKPFQVTSFRRDYRNASQHSLLEVKYTNSLRWNDLKFADKVAKKIFKTRYLVYSKNEFKINESKIIIPCFLVKEYAKKVI